MPYLRGQLRRDDMRLMASPVTPGEINCAIAQAVDEYLGDIYDYDKLNSVIGALECAKLEVYRRIVAPYEDRKIRENGDVFEEALEQTQEDE